MSIRFYEYHCFSCGLMTRDTDEGPNRMLSLWDWLRYHICARRESRCK